MLYTEQVKGEGMKKTTNRFKELMGTELCDEFDGYYYKGFWCLTRAGIDTIGDLIYKTEEEILEILGGKQSKLKYLKRELDEVGLCFDWGNKGEEMMEKRSNTILWK